MAGVVYVTWSLALAAAFWIAVAAVAVADGGQLTRPPLRTQVA